MKPMLRVFTVAVVLALVAPISAQKPEGGRPTDYVLGADDVIEVTVADHPELSKVVQIMPDGKIAFPEVGELQAAGKTPAALAAAIKAALEQHRNNVNVVVTVVTPKSLRVRVVGAVKAPGVYDYRRGMRVLDLVALAGGLGTRPARVRARVLSTTGAVREINISEAIQKPDSDANALLAVDDLLLLDEMDPLLNKAYVIGRVNRPGAYDLGDEGRSLLSVLAEAGNPTEDAALSRCTIIRGSTEIPVNLLSALVQGNPNDPAANIILRPGDMVFVPRNEAMVSVMGSVAKGGQFALPEDRELRVMDVLGLAGGPTQTANPREISVIRMVEGQPSVIKVNVDEIVKKRQFAMNIPVQKGDIIFVPAKGEKGFQLSDIVAPFTALYYLTRITK